MDTDLGLMYRSALEALDEAVCLCDLDGKVLYINPAAERLTGWQREQASGRDCRLILGETCDTILESCSIEVNKKNRGSIELNGRPLQYCVSSLLDHDGSEGFIITLNSPPAIVCEAQECHSSFCAGSGDGITENDLRRRDRLLAGAALAINQLLITGDMALALAQVLEVLGCSANVDRAYIFEHHLGEGGEHQILLRHEWKRDAGPQHQVDPFNINISYSSLPDWYETLSRGMPMRSWTRELPILPRRQMEKLGVLSFLIVPIFAMERFWGFIGFDDRRCERIWTWGEASILMTMASAIGGFMDRAVAQAALRESEEKYRELVESSSSIIIRAETSGRIKFINKFGLQFFGYAREGILGQNVVDTIIPAAHFEACNLKEIMENFKQHPESYSTNVMENMRSNGEKVWIAWTYRPVQNEQGKIVEILCIGNDLTENKLSSEKLKEAVQDLRMARDYLENLVGHANAPIIVWDPFFSDHQIQSCL